MRFGKKRENSSNSSSSPGNSFQEAREAGRGVSLSIPLALAFGPMST